jgi:hypothetical protein
MRVYYGGARIFDSGLISGAGTFSVDFGPGSSTNLVSINMDEPGTNPNGTNGDAWTYQVTEITKERRLRDLHREHERDDHAHQVRRAAVRGGAGLSADDDQLQHL